MFQSLPAPLDRFPSNGVNFNPCFSGTCFETFYRELGERSSPCSVSILVLVELALRLNIIHRTSVSYTNVSILVLVELALRPIFQRQYISQSTVSILVLVELALRQDRCTEVIFTEI